MNKWTVISEIWWSNSKNMQKCITAKINKHKQLKFRFDSRDNPFTGSYFLTMRGISFGNHLNLRLAGLLSPFCAADSSSSLKASPAISRCFLISDRFSCSLLSSSFLDFWATIFNFLIAAYSTAFSVRCFFFLHYELLYPTIIQFDSWTLDY